MARRYYRRTRTVVRAPRKKWGSNIENFNMTTTGSSQLQGASSVLTQNSATSANPTPVIIKAGNFKVQGDAFYITSAAAQVELSLYVVYLPEGVSPPDAATFQQLILSHPEWVLAWKFVSANRVTQAATEQSLSFSMSSRLKRNLNSGDRIVLVGIASAGSALTSANFAGLCQYWTCAN